MKLKVGDKVNFEFLGIPEVGIIEQIRPLAHSSDPEDRYFINDGKFTYPIRLEEIQGKL